MPKKVVSANYLSAYEILFGQWLRVDPCDYYEEEEDGAPLYNNELTPVALLLKEESWRDLSHEAKEMITVILNSPAEILNLMSTSKTKRITKRNVRKYFYNVWKSTFITDLTIKEISGWVDGL